MAETRIQPRNMPRSTGIAPTSTTGIARPMMGATNGVSASPSAGKEAQRQAQRAANQPPLRRGAPGVKLLENAEAARVAGTPPAVALVAHAEPPFSLQQVEILGSLVVEKLNAEGLTDDQRMLLGELMHALEAQHTQLQKAPPMVAPAQPAPTETRTQVQSAPSGASLATDSGH